MQGVWQNRKTQRTLTMKIDVDKNYNIVLKEIFNGVCLETSEGNQITICMRDDTFEVNVCPNRKNGNNWWRVNMQTGRIENMNKQDEDEKIMITLARNIAEEAHKGQFCKDGTTPYIRHPEEVARRVKGNTDAEVIAWLHDVIEDTSVTAQMLLQYGIPKYIVGVVELLTHEKNESYLDYLAIVALNPLARKVKKADIEANLADKPTPKQIRKYTEGLLQLETYELLAGSIDNE